MENGKECFLFQNKRKKREVGTPGLVDDHQAIFLSDPGWVFQGESDKLPSTSIKYRRGEMIKEDDDDGATMDRLRELAGSVLKGS